MKDENSKLGPKYLRASRALTLAKQCVRSFMDGHEYQTRQGTRSGQAGRGDDVLLFRKTAKDRAKDQAQSD
jgi:hypothetical protein